VKEKEMPARKLQVVRTGTTPPDKQREREQAFRAWLSGAETSHLECRNARHIIPGYSDPETKLEVRRGVCIIESPCERCGVVLRKLVGVKDGTLMPGGRSGYDYSGVPGYLLPPEACDGAAMSRERRAEVRVELMERGFAAHGTTLARECARDARRKKS
jgi:hypothetical protein